MKRIHDADVDPVERSAEQVPAIAERIRGERNDELPGKREQREVMREVVGNGDGDERQHEPAGDRRHPLTRHARHHDDDAKVKGGQQQRPGQQQCRLEQHVGLGVNPRPGLPIRRSTAAVHSGVSITPSTVTVASTTNMNAVIDGPTPSMPGTVWSSRRRASILSIPMRWAIVR
jgi:hypothetical protein